MDGGGKNNFVSSFLISHTGFILTDRVLGESERERDWEFERERERMCVRERERDWGEECRCSESGSNPALTLINIAPLLSISVP